MTSLDPQPGFDALVERLFGCRRLTEALSQPLSAEDQTVQSMPDTSPTKWHRAHTTWFFETFLLGPHLDGYDVYDEAFNYLFNSYYEAIGDRHPRPDRGLVTRPGIAEIAAYRRHVDAALAKLFGSINDDAARAELAPLIELGINHEQQHQELLLMDIKHVLSSNRFDPAYSSDVERPNRSCGPVSWVDFDGGITQIGLEPGSEGFRFDNEEPRHQALLQPFALADRLATCGDWLDFIADGGYEDPGLWLSDGWYRCGSENWSAPLYWSRSDNGQWLIHTLGGLREVDPNEPVCHISFYEADAFATWSGARLPTEMEWEHATAAAPWAKGTLLDQTASDEATAVAASNPLHPTAAAEAAAGTLRQMVGDVWQWTGSAYRPYPGYSVPDGAIGEYNGKFMINTMVLRGGSAITPDDHVRASYRNFFHPHTRWHMSGVRLAKDRKTNHV